MGRARRLQGSSGGLSSFAMGNRGHLRALFRGGSNTFRLRLRLISTNGRTNFRLLGDLNRGIGVCLSTSRKHIMVSHTRDNVMSFNGGMGPRSLSARRDCTHCGRIAIGCGGSFTLNA